MTARHCGLLTLVLIVAVTCISCIGAQEPTSSPGLQNITTPKSYTTKCRNGILIPMWTPSENISLGDRTARAIVYFLSMCYLFLGISIISDRFMAAIEVITSKERQIVVKRANGEVMKVSVKVWNETVSNLTLMALGSSAPEILLSIIEVCGNNFKSGELGPGTIVGSAAYNLFIIIGLCIYVVPSTRNSKINHLRVFFVTATWSLIAYIWLYLILAVISPGVVDIWEGVLTFMMFPVTVLNAWIVDRKLLPKFGAKKYHTVHRGVIVQSEGMTDIEMEAEKDELGGDDSDVAAEFEKHRQEYIEMIRELRKKHPNANAKTLEEMAEYEVMNRGPKSRAFYRVQATHKLTGGGNVIKKKMEKEHKKNVEIVAAKSEVVENKTEVFFEPANYSVMENVGVMQVTVKRQGAINTTLYVDYCTEDGTAAHPGDYESAKGTLTFLPGEIEKSFSISIIDDDIFEEDEHFYAKLSNPRVVAAAGIPKPEVSLGIASSAIIMILDDDHAGILHFEEADREIDEAIGQLHVKVQRSSGARGFVSIPFKTIEGTAKAGKDYVATFGELTFANDEHEKYITISINNLEEYEKDVLFYVELGEPQLITTGHAAHQAIKDPNDLSEDDKIAELGRPKLGEVKMIRITVKESKDFKNTVDKLLGQTGASFAVHTSSWREQFVEAVTVSAGDDDDGGSGDEEEDAEEKEPPKPSCGDYVMHYFSLFWKLLFATVPPTDYWGGWACFLVSILWIGLLTAVVGDVASSFGCTVGLIDQVTAISFVALGTSLPDTFASKVAAMNDKYADSSIGNVTGSNAVNVFLGIGIAWSIASIVKYFRGEVFEVTAGSLGFSVTVFLVFAFIAIVTLLLRRHPAVGGELGGPMKFKVPSALFMFLLWMLYIVISALESYGHIKGF